MSMLFEAPLAGGAEWESTTEATPEWEQPEWEMTQQAAQEWEQPGWETAQEWEQPEGETEWEQPEWETAREWEQPEWETEWEQPEWETEWEQPEWETEWEQPEWETEWEQPEWETAQEWEDGAAPLPGRRRRRRRRLRLGRIAQRLAPVVAGRLAAMIPGAGVLAGPMAANLTRQLVREAEGEVRQAEAQLFGGYESNAEIGGAGPSPEAALSEVLAAEAASASTEAEAVSMLSASLPLTLTIMGGRRALLRVMLPLTQANAALIRTMARQGPAGRQLLRVVPTIHRLTAARLRAAARAGRPVTGPMAVGAMATTAQSVLSNRGRVDFAARRNARLRSSLVPPTGRRSAYSRPTATRPMTYRPGAR
jgi:hypothetical protein